MIGTLQDRWQAMGAMHRTDVDDCLGNRDSCGSDIQRSVALASSKFSCMIRVFERVFGNSDNRHLAIEHFVQMSPQSGTMVFVQPDVAIDDNAGWSLSKLGQNTKTHMCCFVVRSDTTHKTTCLFCKLEETHYSANMCIDGLGFHVRYVAVCFADTTSNV